MPRVIALSLLVVLLCTGSALAEHGDQLETFTPADQARAKAMLLRKSDLARGFKATPHGERSADPFCKLSAPDLTLSGEAESPDFDRLAVSLSSVAQVYATVVDANASWQFGTSAAGEKCTRDDGRRLARKDGIRVISSFRRIAFPRLAQRSVAYRVILSSRGVRFYFDNVMLQHSRAHAWLFLGSRRTPVPRAERLRLARVIEARMATEMSDDYALTSDQIGRLSG